MKRADGTWWAVKVTDVDGKVSFGRILYDDRNVAAGEAELRTLGWHVAVAKAVRVRLVEVKAKRRGAGKRKK